VTSARFVGAGCRAADKGVVLGLEVVNRYETNLVNTAAQAVELIGEIGEANVKVHLDSYHMHIEEAGLVHLDSYHMHIEEAGLAQAVETAGSHLGYVHIGESHRGDLGTGNVDFDQLFRALAKQGYTGPITFESFSSRVVSPQLSNVLCACAALAHHRASVFSPRNFCIGLSVALALGVQVSGAIRGRTLRYVVALPLSLTHSHSSTCTSL
jgi:hydroxypyruvate isomerase